MKSIAIIGGGITGVTTAYVLSKRGFDVTLFERHRYAAMEASFANGGQLSASNAEVWTHWGTILKGLKWMIKSDAPLLVNPAPTWHKLSWFAEFMAAIPHYERNTVATTRMAIAARQHLFMWAAEEGIDFDHKRKGILHIYRDKKSFDQAGKISALLAKGGLSRRAVTPAEMKAIEPTLSGTYYGGYFTESDSTGDIHKFTCGLASAAARLGVRILHEQNVTSVHSTGSQAMVSVAQQDAALDMQTFDAVVICAGVRSRHFAAQLGDRVNIYPVKGYSITVELTDETSQASAPNVSLLDDEAKLVTSRLGLERLRVAGTAEFNGIDYDIRADRIAPLIAWVERYFPNINTCSVVPWAGLRPMMPNMMPRVGKGRAPNVFYNTGHGHLGWTLSAVTADMLGQVMSQSS